VNNLWLDTECGINRVAVRSTSAPGMITLTASRSGLEPATVRIQSKAPEDKLGKQVTLVPVVSGHEE
jgi:beta-galactosidase